MASSLFQRLDSSSDKQQGPSAVEVLFEVSFKMFKKYVHSQGEGGCQSKSVRPLFLWRHCFV